MTSPSIKEDAMRKTIGAVAAVTALAVA